jgi:hypothetical protein
MQPKESKMKRLLFILFSILLLTVTGCVTQGPIYRLPKIDTAQSAELTIIRDNSFIGAGVAMTIAIDKIDTYDLPRKSYIVQKVAKGEHTIAAKFENAGTYPPQENMVILNADTGDKIYLLIEPLGLPSRGGKVSRISEARGREFMAESDFLPN